MVISVVWFFVSLPLVTIGPATLGAYAAILDLRSDRNRIDRSRVCHTLRMNGVAALLFSGVPVAFGAVAVTYGVTALREGSLVGEGAALLTGYTALYVALALVPTFVRLAHGDSPIEALRFGLGWLVRHPTPALTTGILSIVLFALLALLTVAFVLLFAGSTFALQITVVEAVAGQSRQSPSTTPVREPADT